MLQLKGYVSRRLFTDANHYIAEQCVLGHLLVEDEGSEIAYDCLKPDGFIGFANACIFMACLALRKRGEPIDEITVAAELADEKHGDHKPIAQYLAMLMAIFTAPTPYGMTFDLAMECLAERVKAEYL